MNIISSRSALLFIVVITVATVASVSAKPKETVTARVLINGCLESDKLAVPINRTSYHRKLNGIGGGGHSPGGSPDSEKCDYSYDLMAVRIDRNRTKLTFTVKTRDWIVEKEITLLRGKNIDLQLEHGVRLIAGY